MLTAGICCAQEEDLMEKSLLAGHDHSRSQKIELVYKTKLQEHARGEGLELCMR